MSCLKKYCLGTYQPRRALPTVDHDICLTCKVVAQRKWRQNLDDKRNNIAEQTIMLQVPKAAKLTPLFWNMEKCKFDDIWTKEDTNAGIPCNATESLMNNLIQHRESRFRELWNKQAF